MRDPLQGARVGLLSHLDFNLARFRTPLVAALRESGATVFALAPRGDSEGALREAGARFVPVELVREGLSPTRAAREVLAMRRALLGLELGLVQAFTLRADAWAGLALLGVGKPTYVAAVTGMGAARTLGGPRGWLVRKALRTGLARADAVIFQNPDDRRECEERGITARDRGHLIVGTGVELARYGPDEGRQQRARAIREEMGAGTKPLVLAVGRLVGEKGAREFFEAAEGLRGRAVFCWVGGHDPGNPTSIPTAEIARWRASRAVAYPGHREDVEDWLEAADIFCLPSYHEGVPRTTQEAMALSLPVVTTDAPGCRETVIDGENGYLVPARDNAALSAALARLLGDPPLRARMGQRSRELCEERFDVRAINARYLDLYRELLLARS